MKITVILISILIVAVACTTENSVEEPTKQEKKNTTEIAATPQIPDGDFVQKYPNGQIQIKGEMRNNKRVGLWTAYYPNGVKQSESTYEKGILSGRTASFYKNGQVRYIGYFLGGKRDGKWDFYSEQGNHDKSEMYVKGELSK